MSGIALELEIEISRETVTGRWNFDNRLVTSRSSVGSGDRLPKMPAERHSVTLNCGQSFCLYLDYGFAA